MLPNSITVLGYELELVKCRGANNRAYRLITSDGHTDFTFKLDHSEDPNTIIANLVTVITNYLKNERPR